MEIEDDKGLEQKCRLSAFVEDVECLLLLEWNLAPAQTPRPAHFRMASQLFVSKRIEDLDCAANNLKDFVEQ